MKEKTIKIVECPRDAMQGIHQFIPTDIKVEYINALLKVGFDILDAGSFVSPKSIPQMRDTAEVFSKLEMSTSTSKLLAIVANKRGGQDAVQFNEINYLGYPFSISETFQLRNTNTTIENSLNVVEELQQLCIQNNKKLLVYISMAFGNPYGDVWNPEIAMARIKQIAELGINMISLADTVGIATEKTVGELFKVVIPELKNVEIGAHLHCTPGNWRNKLDAAYQNGCRRFDTAIRGLGGCPMANDELVGNMATENLVQYLEEHNIQYGLNKLALSRCIEKSFAVFNPVTSV